jgi:hypothetical protein
MNRSTAFKLGIVPEVSKGPAVNAAIAGRSLPADKVEAFAQLMMDQPRIPIDTHALHSLGSPAGWDLEQHMPSLRGMMKEAEGIPNKTALTNSQVYSRLERAMAQALQEIDPRPVNESFATMWEGARADKGLPFQGGALDILKRKGLLQQGALLDPERLREALRAAGWSTAAIAAIMSALPAQPEGPEDWGL